MMALRSRAKGLTNYEIAIIKAMLACGRTKGFTSQMILSYFSSPGRTINVARIYEIRDGTRGTDVAPATEQELYAFLAAFASQSESRQNKEHKLIWTQPPAYIGVSNEQVALLNRFVSHDDSRVDLREKLFQEQHRLAMILEAEWGRFQIDQRLRTHIRNYCELTKVESKDANIFSIDAEIELISRSIGSDTGALGELGEIQWGRFCQNHSVLLELFPEMQQYRAALGAMKADATLAEQEAEEANALLKKLGDEGCVAPEVPDLIQHKLDQEHTDDEQARKKRTYDVASMLGTSSALLYVLLEVMPKIDRTTDAAIALSKRLWDLIDVIRDRMG